MTPGKVPDSKRDDEANALPLPQTGRVNAARLETVYFPCATCHNRCKFLLKTPDTVALVLGWRQDEGDSGKDQAIDLQKPEKRGTF